MFFEALNLAGGGDGRYEEGTWTVTSDSSTWTIPVTIKDYTFLEAWTDDPPCNSTCTLYHVERLWMNRNRGFYKIAEEKGWWFDAVEQNYGGYIGRLGPSGVSYIPCIGTWHFRAMKR